MVQQIYWDTDGERVNGNNGGYGTGRGLNQKRAVRYVSWTYDEGTRTEWTDAMKQNILTMGKRLL